jgi:rhodanese-related sulfurtransferase
MANATSAFLLGAVFSLTCALLPSPLSAQALSRAEKLEGKLRVAMLKANKDIHGPWIKAAELQAILEDTNLVLIDVRQKYEQETSMLPHAIAPMDFAAKFRHGIPKEKRLVVYCTIGFRSGKYAEELAKQGFKAEVLEGGVLAWSFAGGKFFTAGAKGGLVETNHIHVYDREWNIVHPDYIAVMP